MNRLARFAGFGSGDQAQVDRDDVRGEGAAAMGGEFGGATAGALDDPEALREPIIAALRNVHDPEIPINIWEVGLIYDVSVDDDGRARAIDRFQPSPDAG